MLVENGPGRIVTADTAILYTNEGCSKETLSAVPFAVSWKMLPVGTSVTFTM